MNQFIEWVDENLPKIKKNLLCGKDAEEALKIATTPYERALVKALVDILNLNIVVRKSTYKRICLNDWWIETYQDYRMEKFCRDPIVTCSGKSPSL